MVQGASPTLADVARAVGLSIPTVSRALRDHPDVSKASKAQVREAAERLGYRTSTVARALRTGRHHALSFVVPFGLIGWWEPLVVGAANEAHTLGYTLILNPVEFADAPRPIRVQGYARVNDVLSMHASAPVDGYVLVSPPGSDWEGQAAKLEKPVVVIDDVAPHPGFDVWRADNYSGARTAVRHLLDRGCRHIVAAMPTTRGGGLMIDHRLAGYQDELAAAGLETTTVAIDEDDDGHYGAQRSSELEAMIADGQTIDGVFALEDHIAYSIARSLRRRGLRIPDDVALVGFDDDPYAAVLDPALTTVAQPYDEMGADAVRHLVSRVEGANVTPTFHTMPTSLVIRESAPPV